jgi:hypothetical protein
MPKLTDEFREIETKLLRTRLENLAYQQFKPSLDFTTIRRQLALEQREIRAKGDYMSVTRHTVLGRMHELKTGEFNYSIRPFINLLSRSDIIYVLSNGRENLIQTIFECTFDQNKTNRNL